MAVPRNSIVLKKQHICDRVCCKDKHMSGGTLSTFLKHNGRYTVMDQERHDQTADFKDKHLRLVLLGLLQVVLGGFCALLALLFTFLLGLFLIVEETAEQSSIGGMLYALLFYVFIALWFVVMGVGSMAARRWARALSLTTAWLWFVTGLFSMLPWSGFFHSVYARSAMMGGVPPEMARPVSYGITAFMLFGSVFLPGLMVLFYSGRHVKATCEHRNPEPSWTDNCPLPLLAVAIGVLLWGGVVGLGIFAMGISGVFGFFGTVLTGVPARATGLLLTACSIWIAWGVYKLRTSAWWGAVILTVLLYLSMIITFLRLGTDGFMIALGAVEEDLAQMMPGLGAVMVHSLICLACILGYLVYVKRYVPAS